MGRLARILFAIAWAGAVAAGCSARSVGPEQVQQQNAPLVFEFFPNQLPFTWGSPFGAPTAGSGVWPFAAGPPASPFVCRECTFTGVLDSANLSCTSGCIDDHIALKTTVTSAVQVPSTLASYTGGLFGFGTNTSTNAAEGLDTLVQRAITDHAVPQLSSDAPWLNDLADDVINGENGVCALLSGWVTENAPNANFNCTVNLFGDPQSWIVAYEPNQWRFLGAQLISPPAPPAPPATAQFIGYHPYPVAFFEARMRGARSFCAMREAALAQAASGKRTMGSVSLGSGAFALFQAGQTQTQLDVAPPQKLTSSTSSNAFVIPLAVRTQISPLSGFFVPQMPEKSTPVVWVSGDAEVLSAEQVGSVLVGYDEAGQPIYKTLPQKGFLNGQHTDIFIGQQSGGTVQVQARIPIWAAVFGQVSLTLEFETGRLVRGFSGDGGGNADWSAAGDGRVLYFPPLNLGTQVLFPAPRSALVDRPVGSANRPWVTPTGAAVATDAPWFPFAPNLLPGLFVPIEPDGPIFGDNLIAMGFGVRTRALMNDDRSLVIMDRVKETFNLGVGVGFDIGPLTVEIVGSTNVEAEARQFITLREHASGVGTAKLLPYGSNDPDELGPQSNFVAIPETKSNIAADALSVDANFVLDIDLGIVEIHKEWTTNFITVGANSGEIASFIFPENRRLRVGEYTDLGFEFKELLPNPDITFRSTYSHLADPNATDPQPFASFPQPSASDDGSSQDVGRCLEDPKVPPPPPPVRIGKSGDPPFKTCAWGLPGEDDDIDIWSMPANICNGAPNYPNIEHFLNSSLIAVAASRAVPSASDPSQKRLRASNATLSV